MTKEDIIRMAREAGLRPVNEFAGAWITFDEPIERFAALIAAAERNRTWTQDHWTEYERSIAAQEREMCAKVCEELVPDMSRPATEASIWDIATFDCAVAIRARKTHD